MNIHDTEHYVADVDRGGLGLPDRDYYLDAGASADSTRKAYVAHIARMFVLAGQDSSWPMHDARPDPASPASPASLAWIWCWKRP